MRPIKFRAWFKQTSEMVYSDNGDDYKHREQIVIRRSKEYPKSDMSYNFCKECFRKLMIKIPEVMEQS